MSSYALHFRNFSSINNRNSMTKIVTTPLVLFNVHFKKSTTKFLLPFLLLISSFSSFGQTYFDMSLANYSESFTAWTSPATNSWSSVAISAGTIPLATSVTTASASFTTGTSGGIQNGSTNIQFLSTGTTDNSSSVALDLNLNFTGRNAGNLSFDAASVFNSTGNRAGTLRVYYSINGTTWTEITGTNLPFSANNNVTKTGSINLALPTAINNQATVKLRFYYHNGGTALASPTGSRPKISIDNVAVTALSAGPNLSVNSSSVSNLNYFTGNGPSVAGNYTLTGSSLTGDITITAPANFEISNTSNSSGFVSSLLLTPSSGSINTPIYVRLIANLSQNAYTGNITHTGGGITTNPSVSLSGAVTDIVLPTKLAITAISPSSPQINAPFSVTVKSQDNASVAQNVAAATSFTLSLNTGTGILGGTLTGTIPAGANSITLTGVTYNKEENGVSLTATRTAGDALLAGNSANFNTVDNLTAIIRSVQSGNWNSPTSWTCNCIPALSDTVRVRTGHTITVAVPVLPLDQGCAKLIVDVGATLNIQIPNFKMGFPVVPPVASGSIHLTMGNPSNAVVDVNSPNNYLLDKPQYAVSYNKSRGASNWVSWYLSSTWIGSTPRQNDFRPDNTLPSGWYQVNQNDYSGSGFDRGHMTPSGDRTSSVANNSATFFMTNMIPQAPDNNQGPWEGLESYLRGQLSANGGQEIYIISGSYGVGGTGSNGFATTIAGGQVTVPAQTYKIAVILSNGIDDVNRVTTTTRVIAIIMPNIQGIRTNDWRIYRTSVDAIEAATGHDFLSNVPPAIQSVIEASVDTVAN
jgi:endonuclease G, mitochondrial